MNKRDFLLEIGVEELPARFISDAIEQLREKVENWLQTERLHYEGLRTYATPRRLALIIEGLAERQEDVHEEAKGPARKIAVDEAGNWTKAAHGFARGQSVDTDTLFFKEVNGVEYVYANKFISGKETIELLPAIKEIIVHLHFPQNMRWGSHSFRFARPIQWLVALYGKDVIPFTISQIETGSVSYGHRFLGNEVTFTFPSDYEKTLREAFVIVDPAERMEIIGKQLDQLARENKWVIPVDKELLDEVTNLVEYPTALSGSFDESFLALPKEVLITSMREHQRYFPVENEKGELLPYFITVRNGNNEHIENVAKGNEKVLRARLADAAFFYEEDQKMEIDDALKRLEQIVYHEELGSIGDKVRRIVAGVKKLSQELKVDETTANIANRAAQICKFDLVTQMVNEFTELQGRMGEVYAELAGEKVEVAKAIEEHYKPRSAGDSTPQSLAGTLISIVDKLDTIVACFAIGLIPTGSQDPYALRRQAAGIIHMLDDQKLDIEIEQLIAMGLTICEGQGILKRPLHEVEAELSDFFKLRVKAFLQEAGMKYDVIEAVLEGRMEHIPTLAKKAEFIEANRDKESFKAVIEALSRVTNIAKKAEGRLEINDALFEKEEERALYVKYIEVKDVVKEALSRGAVEEAFTALSGCKEVINHYFDHIMVMAENEEIKANRLAQMGDFAEVIRSFAQFQALVL